MPQHFLTPFFSGSCNPGYRDRFGETKCCIVDLDHLSPTGNICRVNSRDCIEYSVKPNRTIILYRIYDSCGYVLPEDSRRMKLSKENGCTFALLPEDHVFITSSYFSKQSLFDVTIQINSKVDDKKVDNEKVDDKKVDNEKVDNEKVDDKKS